MFIRPRIVRLSTLAILSVILVACGPSGQTVSRSAITADLTGLQQDRSAAPTRVYIRPKAPGLGAYSRFIIEPVRIDYRDPKIKELDPKDVQRMQSYFQNAMIAELRKGGYTVGTRTEPGTMLVSLSVAGLKAPSAAANVSVLLAPIALSVGEVTVEGVFREATSNRIDAVVLERSKGSRVFNAKPWSTWADVESAFDGWAEGFRKAVDKAHGR